MLCYGLDVFRIKSFAAYLLSAWIKGGSLIGKMNSFFDQFWGLIELLEICVNASQGSGRINRKNISSLPGNPAS